MKTNHQRGFKAKKFNHGQRTLGYYTFSGHGETLLSGVRVAAVGTMSGGSSKLIRRDTAGAKKYVRSRTRFHENSATRKLLTSVDECGKY